MYAKLSIACLVLIVSALVGCGKREDMQSTVTIESHIVQSVEESLNIDADIVVPQKKEYAVYNVIPSEITTEMSKKYMGENVEKDVVTEPYEEGQFYVNAADGSSFGYVENILKYKKNDAVDETLYSILKVSSEEQGKNYQNKELEFSTIKEIETKAKAEVMKIWDGNVDKVQIFGFDRQDVKAATELYQKNWDDDEIDNVPDENAYFIRMGFQQEDIPVYSSIEEEAIECSMTFSVSNTVEADVLITESGTRYVAIQSPYKITSIRECKEILTPKQVLDLTVAYFEDIILDEKNKIQITGLQLEYVAIDRKGQDAAFTLEPYWRVSLLSSKRWQIFSYRN